MRSAVIAAAVALTAALAGCDSTVIVQGDGKGGAGAAAAGECVDCRVLGISQHFHKGLPFCPGEQEKYDALLACACQESTCASPVDICKEPDGPAAYGLCNGGPVGGSCRKCLEEKCAEVWSVCDY
jgi:hypothetical protein